MLETPTPIEVFCGYSSEDEYWYRVLEKHLALLRKQERILLWHPHLVVAGTPYQQEIEAHLNRASVIILLISSSFIANEYTLMQRALELSQKKQAYVVPILLKALDWNDALFAHLELLPSNRKPITSWRDQDEAFQDIVTSLRLVLDHLTGLPDISESIPISPTASLKPTLVSSTSILLNKTARADFDVFLCYHTSDRSAVKQIGEQLKQQGILPWLDEWELRPGQPWQRALEKQIAQIKAAAVFVGPSGFGPWQEQETDALLREFITRSCPVIPVLLPNIPREKMPHLPIFLRGMTWVDFRVFDPDPLGQLIWGIIDQHPRER
jgi:hypothetical protein